MNFGSFTRAMACREHHVRRFLMLLLYNTHNTEYKQFSNLILHLNTIRKRDTNIENRIKTNTDSIVVAFILLKPIK